MLRKISLITLFVIAVLSLHAQGVKFGVHIDPGVSFMNSNDDAVVPSGANFNFAFGVEGEYYFADGENYSITFGANFGVNRGGKLKYPTGGFILPNSTLDNRYFLNNQNDIRANESNISGLNLELTPNTTVNYNINYVEVPVGFKLRTNELGQSYLRAFFHLPVLTFMVPVSANATVNAPDPTGQTSSGFYTNGDVNNKNIYKDIVPFQLMIGVGAGVEFSPNEDGGLRLIGGFYYNYGFIDAVKGNKIYSFDNIPFLYQNNAITGFHNIGLRLGVIF
jgi:hypothetical protein